MKKDGKKLLRIVGLSLFFLAIAVFAFINSFNLIFGVKIKEVNIKDGATVADSVIEVEGNAKNATRLTLNGQEISIDREGNFNESLALSSGYNLVTIEAEDKFGNTDQKSYQLIH